VHPGFGHTLHLDYSGLYPDLGEGDRYICAIVESYTSYCWLYGTKDMTATMAVKCLLKVVGKIGAFKNLVTDQASAFLGSVMTTFCKIFEITKISTTAYSPRSNSRVERLQGTLINCLRATCTEGRRWGSALAFVEIALRSASVKGMGISAFKMINGSKRMCLPIDIAKIAVFDDQHKTPQDTIKKMRMDLDLMNKIIWENIVENQVEIKRVFDEKVTPYKYEVGTVVLVNDPVEKVGISGKLRRKWVGPFIISWLNISWLIVIPTGCSTT